MERNGKNVIVKIEKKGRRVKNEWKKEGIIRKMRFK